MNAELCPARQALTGPPLTTNSPLEKSCSGGYRRYVAARKPVALDRTIFGRNFNQLFLPLNMSARAFALEIGVGEDKISKWRKGALPVPELPTLLKMCVRFGVSIDVLLEDVNDAYTAMIKTIRVVQYETVRAEQHRVTSILPEKSEGSHESLAALPDLEPSQRHAAVAAAVELLRLLLGPAGLDAATDASQPQRRKAG